MPSQKAASRHSPPSGEQQRTDKKQARGGCSTTLAKQRAVFVVNAHSNTALASAGRPSRPCGLLRPVCADAQSWTISQPYSPAGAPAEDMFSRPGLKRLFPRHAHGRAGGRQNRRLRQLRPAFHCNNSLSAQGARVPAHKAAEPGPRMRPPAAKPPLSILRRSHGDSDQALCLLQPGLLLPGALRA